MRNIRIHTTLFTLALAFCLLPPVAVSGQDLTESEREQFRQQRERLIQEGVLHSLQQLPTVLPADYSGPYIDHSDYTEKSEPVDTDDSRASDFHPDGTRFYILGRDTRNVVEYHLSDAWDIETINYAGEFDISPDMGTRSQPGTVPHGLFLRKENGEKMWVFNRTEIWEYTLSTPWDVTTATQTGYQDLSSDLIRGHDIDFKPDGTILYVDDRVHQGIYQYALSTPWDVETATLTHVLDISSEQEEVRGTQFNQDGSRMYLMDTGRRDVLEYYLSTPYNITTASFVDDYSVGSQSSNPRGLTFNPDFTAFYVTEATNNRIYQYELRYVDPDESAIDADHSKVIANGSASTRISVTLLDKEGVRLPGRQVSLTASSSDVDIDAVNSTSNSSGVARFDVSNTTMETVTFEARAMGTDLDESVTVRFVGLDPDESRITANREKVLANGTAFATVTVTARDEDGDALHGVDLSLHPDGGSSEIQEIQSTTNSNGLAEFRVRNQVAEAVTYQARGMGVTLDRDITISFVTVDPALSTVSVSPVVIQANNEDLSTITVQTRDEDGDLLAGASVSLEAQSGSSTIQTLQSTTDSNGEAFFRVRNSIPEIVNYTVIAEDIPLDETAEVHFVPIAPVSLAPEEVGTRSFIANWEPVEGAETYLIDVATDGNFTTYAAGYQNREAGNSSSILVENLQPGTTYHYRIRARSMGLTSTNSETVTTTTYPETPVAIPPADLSVFSFTAKWEPAEGAEQYRIDVASDSQFEQILNGYEDVAVESGTELEVDGLAMGTRYFYRVRSEAGPRKSPHSNSIETSTLTISSENSGISKAQIRVLADGNQTNEILVTVKSEEGTLLRGLEVILESPDEHTEIEAVQPVTDQQGVARFTVRRSEPGTVTYQIRAGEIVIGDVTVEFLEADGLLKLGDNFPNPFSGQTRLPVTVPEMMDVRLIVYNALGAPVRTVMDEPLETGYHEIVLDIEDLASGVYFYRLIANGEVKTGKMVLVK